MRIVMKLMQEMILKPGYLLILEQITGMSLEFSLSFFFFYFFFISTFSFFIIEFPKIKPNVNKVVLNIYILEAKQKIKL
jgi:hypothetical protein